MTPTRRALLAAAPAWTAIGGASSVGLRLACLDYGLAETALALGLVPVALPDPAGYRAWVIEPALPLGVQDLGARTQPSLDLLAELRPDAILAVPDHDGVRPRLERIAPVLRLPLQGDGNAWALAVAAARSIAAFAGRPASADRLLAAAEAACAAGPPSRNVPPVLLASVVDSRHLVVYGANGILGAALSRMGLRIAWTASTGRWGSVTVGADALAAVGDAVLLVIDPVAPDALAAMADSPLWRALPFVRAGRVGRLPPVLMFGGLPAAIRFAGLLPGALAGAGIG